MPSLANPFQGMALATLGTKPMLTPEVGPDIYGKQSSLANPFQISGASTYGIKPGVGIKAFFSVGTAGDIKTPEPSTSILNASITTGIMTFDFPQLHPYIGVGDKVSWSGGDGYLSRKIDVNNWFIVNEFGIPKPNITLTTISSIAKTFNTLEAAISGATPGIYSLLGSYDLKALDVQPNIVCYFMNDTTTGISIPNVWNVDASRYIKVYAPWDIKEECNVSQAHQTIWGTGYNLTSVGDAFTIDQYRVVIQGLQIATAGNSGIVIGNDSTYNVIRNNVIINGTEYGIKDTNNNRAFSSNYYISNVIYGCGTGIDYGEAEITATPKYAFIYNNTIVDNDIGVSIRTDDWGITYNAVLSNNILQNNSIVDIDAPYDPGPTPPTEGMAQSFLFPPLLHKIPL